MITVYVLLGLKKYRYTGITKNIRQRLSYHNKGKNKSTKKNKPYTVIYTESCVDYSEARKREKFLKSGAGRDFLLTLE